MYGSYPVNQYIEPDIVVDLPKQNVPLQETSNNSRVSNNYMDPDSVMEALNVSKIQVTTSSKSFEKATQNDYVNFKFNS